MERSLQIPGAFILDLRKFVLKSTGCTPVLRAKSHRPSLTCPSVPEQDRGDVASNVAADQSNALVQHNLCLCDA
jgi:hypothetical protein